MAWRRKREWPRDRERQGRRRRIANGFNIRRKMAWGRIGIGHRSGGQGREKMIGHGTRKGKEERKGLIDWGRDMEMQEREKRIKRLGTGQGKARRRERDGIRMRREMGEERG